MRGSWIATLAVLSAVALVAAAPPAPLVPVHHSQASLRGFLRLSSLDGAVIGDGELTQTTNGGLVTTRTAFHFADGSVEDETAVFSQRGEFRLERDHVVQSGAAFEHPLTMDVDRASGRVTVRTTAEDGTTKVDDEQMRLPENTSNGLLITLLENTDGATFPLRWPLVVATPSPRLVTLVITRAGSASFSIGRDTRRATDYLVKTDIGGMAGIIAPFVGKAPPDAHVWVIDGNPPVFARSEAPFAPGGPLFRVETTGPHLIEAP